MRTFRFARSGMNEGLAVTKFAGAVVCSVCPLDSLNVKVSPVTTTSETVPRSRSRSRSENGTSASWVEERARTTAMAVTVTSKRTMADIQVTRGRDHLPANT